MNQQYPQPQPNQPNPQQPGWGGPQTPPAYGQPHFQPLPPKKSNVGKIIGLGCGGLVGLFIVLGAIGAAVGGNSDKDSSSAKPAAPAAKDEKPVAEKPAAGEAKTSQAPKSEAKTEEPKPKPKVVTFKVWGTAPSGALGPLDITYGSDSDTRKGNFKNGKFEATLPLDDDALYFNVMAQLQGSGDINCSVTVDGHTEKAHAAGGYNICNAQANAGLLGGWN
ncbi:hypothetical protein [Streptomyces sp. NPDC006334]|uniref:hypothetical protein n=1 Tax=Streptomyces sp. NPDC006334 TaxID=3156754 RepID=UPI0033A04F7A